MLDAFDNLMNKTCTILKENPALSPDDCGQPSHTLVQVSTGIPCRISTIGNGREYKVDKEVTVSRWKVFMRPTEINEHYTLRIDAVDYNVLEVLNPAGLDHHYEVMVERVKA